MRKQVTLLFHIRCTYILHSTFAHLKFYNFPVQETLLFLFLLLLFIHFPEIYYNRVHMYIISKNCCSKRY